MSINKVIILGRLGTAPELNFTPGGVACCKFTVATTESWKKDGEKQEKTEWHKIVVWRKLAELCLQYLAKGRQVYIEGKIETRNWEKDNQKHYMTEIVADKVEFIGDPKKREGQDAQATEPSNGKLDLDKDYAPQTDPAFTADDIQF